MPVTEDVKIRLTEVARKAYGDDQITITDEWFEQKPGPFGKTLREVLDDPRLGEKECAWYLEFKASGGFE